MFAATPAALAAVCAVDASWVAALAAALALFDAEREISAWLAA